MNKPILQSFINHNKCIELESTEEFIKDNSIKTTGWYFILNENISALYHLNNKFILQYSNKEYIISNESFAKRKIISNNIREFEYYNNHTLIFKFTYKAEIEIDDINIFGLVENEDFDWGLFLVNIINNQQRMKNILKYFSEETPN